MPISTPDRYQLANILNGSLGILKVGAKHPGLILERGLRRYDSKIRNGETGSDVHGFPVMRWNVLLGQRGQNATQVLRCSPAP
jgi:hypothetical protein